MNTRKLSVSTVIGLALVLIARPLAQSPEAQAKQDAADVARLVDVLQIRAGWTVADIGAGGGQLSLLLSPIVGNSGRVFATDVNKDRLSEISGAVTTAGLTNVTVLAGDANRTNLADQCCDAMFMRHVYHHLGDPARMNHSLWQGLKAGGRLAVVDFAPKSKRSAPPGQRNEGERHGVMPATVIDELAAAGFSNIRQETWTEPYGFLIVAEKKRQTPDR